jgi:hypothetical protein
MTSLARISLQSDCPAWGNLTWPKVGEFHLANGGAHKDYDAAGFVKDLRTAKITQHFAQKKHSGIDARTTRQPG